MVVGYETKINRTKINQTKYNQTKINRGRNPTNCSIRSRDIFVVRKGEDRQFRKIRIWN